MTTGKSFEILSFLKRLGAEPVSQKEMNRFIEVCFKTASFYLNNSNRSVIKHLLTSGLSLRDIAVDMVSSIFSQKPNDGWKVLKSSFEKWNPPIQTEAEAQFFLNLIIAKVVNQHVSKLLKSIDPVYGKIYYSLKHLIQKNKLNKKCCMGILYITETNTIDSTRKLITHEEFNNLPAELFTERKKLFYKLFNYLTCETNYYSAVPLTSLVLRLKQQYIHSVNFIDFTFDSIKSIEIDDAIDKAFKDARDKINNYYVKNNKLKPEDPEWISKTLEDITRDLKDGGICHSL